MKQLIPRDYQQDAVQACIASFEAGEKASLVISPTGSGKSLMIAMLADHFTRVGRSVLVITPRILLLRQQTKYMPSSGIVSATIGNDLDHDQAIGTYQTLVRRNIRQYDVIIIDECHLFPHDCDSSEFADMVRGQEGASIIGFTATAVRDNETICSDGWWKQVFKIQIDALIEQGYLVPPVSFLCGQEQPDNDISDADLIESVVPDVEKKLREIGCKKVLIFCRDIEKIRFVHALFECHSDFKVYKVHSRMPQTVINRTVDDFRASKKPSVLVNCSMLITGVDIPETDGIVILRRIGQVSTFIQIIGRGLRPSAGKAMCAILDFGGNIKRFGAINELFSSRVRPDMSSGREMVRYCPNCSAENPMRAKQCIFCEFAFSERITLKPQSSGAQVLSGSIRHAAIVDQVLVETESGRSIVAYVTVDGCRVLTSRQRRGRQPSSVVYSRDGKVGRLIKEIY